MITWLLQEPLSAAAGEKCQNTKTTRDLRRRKIQIPEKKKRVMNDDECQREHETNKETRQSNDKALRRRP